MAQIGFVGENFLYIKILGGAFQKGCKEVSVMGGPAGYFNAGDYIGLHPAHQMAFDPLPVIHFPAVFLIEPPNESESAEARGINGELCLYFGKRKTGGSYQVHQNRCHSRKGHILTDSIEVGWTDDEPLVVGFLQVAGEPPGREQRIDLEGGSEYHVGHGHSGPTHCLFRLGNTRAQVCQQFHEPSFFLTLSGVVGCPVLGISYSGNFDGLGGFDDCGFTIRNRFPLDGIFDSKYVLTLHLSDFVVWASALGYFGIQPHLIMTIARLRGNQPPNTIFLNFAEGGDFQTSLLSGVHLKPTYRLDFVGIIAYNVWYCQCVSG